MQESGTYDKICENCKESYKVRWWSDDGRDWLGHQRGSYSHGDNDNGCPYCDYSEKEQEKKKEEAKEFIEEHNTMFKNNEEIFDYLLAYYKKFGGKIRIASYGMYLGISKGKDWNPIYPSMTREFIDYVNKDDLRMIIGTPYKVECYKGCPHCEKKHQETIQRFKDTEFILGLKHMRLHPESHLKLYNIGDLYIAGGINLSLSGFADVAFIITDQEQKKALDKLFEEVWKESN